MEEEIKQIEFPNTATSEDITSYRSGREGVTIEKVLKNGEMAKVTWFAIKKEGKLIAEIKESICNVYYE